MALTSGTRLGPYEILAAIGAGGMGEVYRARDTKLNRDVAIKVLPELFSSDPDRLARFQREAQVLASLNHPYIAHIHGLEDTPDGIRALVMELVEGPTLADRIAQGAVPLAEALPIARQIAEALEAAHEQGIVHRDLKPANIKVREDGTVKVLDFGLAKLASPESSGTMAGVSQSPTLTTPAMTLAGVILGTAAYMAPEQARGKVVDKRADVWAFGCVLFEMLTATRAFGGDEITDTLAFIITKEPDWARLPAETPDAVRVVLRRCLQKDPKRRFRDIGDVRLELDEAHGALSTGSTVVSSPARRNERFAWVAGLAVVALLASGGTAVWINQTTALAPQLPETRLDIATPSTVDPFSFAISSDGRQLAYVASENGVSRLWLRPLNLATAQPLSSTEGASYPFWSPDSKSIAFFADGKLKRLDIGSGLARTLANASGPRGGSWSQDGTIVFVPETATAVLKVSAFGGEPVAVTRLASGQSGHRFPKFLPDGKRFLFYARGLPASAGIFLGSLDAPGTKRLTPADTEGEYAPPGWLMFVGNGALMARHFDVEQGELSGDPLRIADPVAVSPALSTAAFSVSATGLLTYRAGTAATQLTWFDRSGKVLSTIGQRDDNYLLSPALAPDGRRVAVQRTVQGNTDIWLMDGARAVRFTVDPSIDQFPLWAPDGSQVVFGKINGGAQDLYQKSTSGAGREQLLVASSENKTPHSWSRDGQFILYMVRSLKTASDIWVLPMTGDRKPFPFLETNFEERSPSFSPDGRWVAYVSDESGRFEVYIRPFPGPGGQWVISTSGGVSPRWRSDGKELYYIAPDSKLMAVPIALKSGAIEPGLPFPLFQTRIAYGGATIVGISNQYDVSSDGRFLMNVNTEDAAPITVIQNWHPKN